MSISVIWDLDSIFDGGNESKALADFLDQLTVDLDNFERAGLPEPLANKTHPAWVAAIQTLFNLSARLNQAASFVGCLISQNVKDDKALQLMGQIEQLGARLGSSCSI